MAVAALLVAAWAAHFGSNSLVVAEGSTILFLAATAMVAHTVLGPRRPDRWAVAVVALACVRASGAYVLCREEHGPACEVRVRLLLTRRGGRILTGGTQTTFGIASVSGGVAVIALLGPLVLASAVWRQRRVRQLGTYGGVARAEGVVVAAALLTALLWQLPADARQPSLVCDPA
jgi:hypothetical protein